MELTKVTSSGLLKSLFLYAAIALFVCIPLNLSAEVIQGFESFGTVDKGFLGLTVEDTTQALADAFGLKVPSVIIVGAKLGSSAEKAGFILGDFILEINGDKVVNTDEFNKTIFDHPGQKIVLSVFRKGKKKNIEVLIGTQEEHRRWLASRKKNTSKSWHEPPKIDSKSGKKVWI